VVLAVGWRFDPEPRGPDPAVVAVQEFEVALHYMRRSAAVTNREVNDTLGQSLRDALIASRDSVRERGSKTGG
jgi:hypothetical protein